MRSVDMFKDEFKNIGSIPGVLFSQQESDKEPPPTSTIDELVPDAVLSRTEEPVAQAPDQAWMKIPGFDGAVLFIDLNWVEKCRAPKPSDFIDSELGIDIGAAVDEAMTQQQRVRRQVAMATQRLGTEAFATYLPWHKHACSRATSWGMWFFVEPLVYWAASLRAVAGGSGLTLSSNEAFDLAFLVAYRHEQFHFHVERFAIRQEVIQRSPIYLRYDRQVYSAADVCRTESWLEEALAQAVVLESTFLYRRLGVQKRALRSFLESEFRQFGPGYKHFDCTAFRGTGEAHKLLGAQVVSGEKIPAFEITEFVTPKKEYAAAPALVPGYLAFQPWFVSRFQLGMPPARKWKTFAEAAGFQHVGPGPGDHDVWQFGRQKVQINQRGNELDLASVKAVAKLLKKPLRRIVQEIRAA